MENSEEKEKKLVTHGSIHAKVAEQVAEAGPAVEEALVDALVSTEINRRTQIATTGLKAISAVKADINKISRADTKTFDKDGNATEVFSEVRYKELKQKRENLERLEKAFNKALNDNTGEAYGELDKLSKSSGGSKAETPAEA